MILSNYLTHGLQINELKYKRTVLLDTCFIIYELDNGKEKKLENFLKNHEAYITSFNFLELKHVAHKQEHIHKALKRLLDSDTLKVISIDVKPGEREKEVIYANKTDSKILQIIQDPSDAVLIAAAIKSRSDVLTRDKHHIFKAVLENQLKEYKIQVYNDINTYENSLINTKK